jgi:cephalosporin-C deacetylase
MLGLPNLLALLVVAPFPNGLVVQPDHATGLYKLGEKVGWTVTNPTGTPIKFQYTVRKNGKVGLSQGTLEVGTSPVRVETGVTEPAMVFMQITPDGGKTMDFGAGVSPEKLKPVRPAPKDFDRFWADQLKAVRQVPENAIVTPAASVLPTVDYSTIQMDHVNGTHVYGQMARPMKPGKFPAILMLQWASPPYPLSPWWIVNRAAQGFIVLDIEPHNVLPTEPQAYYDALPQELKNYASIGQDSRETSYFVEMYLRGVRAVDYLRKRPDWDGKTLIVTGGSMGGQQSLAVAGLCPEVTHMMVAVPAGCDLNAELYDRQGGYPFFWSGNAKAMETARYLDAINFAPKIRAKSLVAMGFVDTVCPPAGIWTAFNRIRSKKEVAPMVDSPHNNLSTPEQQKPWTDRSEAWFRELAGRG